MYLSVFVPADIRFTCLSLGLCLVCRLLLFSGFSCNSRGFCPAVPYSMSVDYITDFLSSLPRRLNPHHTLIQWSEVPDWFHLKPWIIMASFHTLAHVIVPVWEPIWDSHYCSFDCANEPLWVTTTYSPVAFFELQRLLSSG